MYLKGRVLKTVCILPGNFQIEIAARPLPGNSTALLRSIREGTNWLIELPGASTEEKLLGRDRGLNVKPRYQGGSAFGEAFLETLHFPASSSFFFFFFLRIFILLCQVLVGAYGIRFPEQG